MRIIIGIGTGRSGTHSLASLINLQKNSICFHELNPACMKWSDAEVTVLSMLREFIDCMNGKQNSVTVDYTSPHRDSPLKKLSSMANLEVIGDIAFYYLNYIPFLLEQNVDIRIPCIQRPREETIRSFVMKMRSPETGIRRKIANRLQALILGRHLIQYRNHWIDHDGSKWKQDVKWDKCYPKFEAKNLFDAIGKYWDYYYEKSRYFENKYPERVKIFNLNDLNSENGQNAILQFCGFTEDKVLHRIHSNKSLS